MKLLGSTKKDVDANKNSENVPKLESLQVYIPPEKRKQVIDDLRLF